MERTLLPQYAASLCSAEWLETVASYQHDPQALQEELQDFARSTGISAAIAVPVIVARGSTSDAPIPVVYGCPIRRSK